MSGRNNAERGNTLIEFALVGLLCCILMLSFVEFGRMVLVYTTVANSARAGLRYAIVHGNTSTGSGVNGPSGPGDNPAQVVTMIKNFASTGLLDKNRLVISVTYPDARNSPGGRVDVSVIYPYDPLTTYFPLRVNLGSVSEGVITF